MNKILSIFYTFCYRLAKFYPSLYPKKIILTFHSIGNDDWEHSHSIKQLNEYLYILTKQGYEFTDLNSLLESEEKDDKKSCTLTFDDGYKNLISVKDLPKKGYPCSVFLLTDHQNLKRSKLKNKLELLSKNDVKELIISGWSIGSHGQTHSNLRKLALNDLEKEIIDSKITLEKDYGQKILAFAFPNGNSNPQSIKLLTKAGYKWGLTMDDSILSSNFLPYSLPRVGVMKYHQPEELAGAITICAIYARKIVKTLKSILFLI